MTELSIIIPTLNEYWYIPKLLESIAAQRFDGKLQVVVVDGKSGDNTRKQVKKFGDKLDDLTFITTEPNVGHQRNIGATKAKYRYLLFIDADVILPLDCLNTLAKKVGDKDNFIAAVLHRSPKMSVVDVLTLIVIYILFFISWLARSPVTNGDFILTTRDVHDRLHGFKEGAILGEDTDYGFRAVKAGAKYRFYFSPHISASDRRIKQMGRIKLVILWSKVFIRVRKHGPTYGGIDYPFGHYEPHDKVK